jgi:hypothetical protein
LGSGQSVEVTQGRPQQLVERRKGELTFRLHSARREDVHVGSTLASIEEEGRLSHTRLAPYSEGTASRSPRGLEQRSDQRPLAVPPIEHRCSDGAHARPGVIAVGPVGAVHSLPRLHG